MNEEFIDQLFLGLFFRFIFKKPFRN